jgi:hypothetical protein
VITFEIEENPSVQTVDNMFSNRGPAARRRQQRSRGENSQRDGILPISKANRVQKYRAPSRLYDVDKSHKDYLINNRVSNNDSMKSIPLSQSPIHLSHLNSARSIDTITDLNENAVIPTSSAKRNRRVSISKVSHSDKPPETGNAVIPTSSAKRNRRVSISKVSHSEKPPETGHAGIKSSNHKDDKETTPPARQSTVTVQRVNQSARSNVANNNQSDRLQTAGPEKLDMPSKVTSEPDQINVIKIPRRKSDVIQRTRSSSVRTITVVNLEKPPIEMPSIKGSSKITPQTTNPKKNTTSGVTVKKLPRNSSAH